MTNLTQKFDELQGDLQAHHGATLDKLDEILAALGMVADPTAQLADILTAIGDFRADLETFRSQTIERLDAIALIRDDTTAIKDAIPGLAEDLDDIRIHMASADLHLEGIEAKGVEIGGLIETGNALLGSIDVAAAALSDTLGLKPSAEENIYVKVGNIEGKLDTIIQALGVYQNAAEDTVLAYLYEIARYAPCACGGTAPEPLVCTAPYDSSGQLIMPWSLLGGTSQMFAEFPDPPPAGLAFGTTFGLVSDYTELDSLDWTQWNVYVESDQPTYSDGQDAFRRFPTNVWRRMDGTGPRAFAVDARGSIVVHFCKLDDYTTTPIPPGECVRYDAEYFSHGSWYLTVPAYPSGYTMTLSTPGYVTDGSSGSHGPLNYGIGWDIPIDVGTGPWVVNMGGDGTENPPPFVNICNPSPS